MGKIFSDGIEKTLDVVLKEHEYIVYIIEHIKNVNTAYEKLIKDRIFDPINIKFEDDGTELVISPEDMDSIKAQLANEVKSHDMSKFSEQEFIPYRFKFHRTDEEEKRFLEDPEYAKEILDNFEIAWEHHYLNNDHHPGYWVYSMEDGKVVEHEPRVMSAVAILHMICDWSGMSIKFRNSLSPVSWYATADKEKSLMHPHTKIICEYFMNLFFDDAQF